MGGRFGNSVGRRGRRPVRRWGADFGEFGGASGRLERRPLQRIKEDFLEIRADCVGIRWCGVWAERVSGPYIVCGGSDGVPVGAGHWPARFSNTRRSRNLFGTGVAKFDTRAGRVSGPYGSVVRNMRGIRWANLGGSFFCARRCKFYAQKGSYRVRTFSVNREKGGGDVEDAGIIELLFSRSERAIAELAGKYGAGCRRIAGNILGDARDVEECVNDTYLGVWNAVPPRRPDPLRAYVYRVARNLAVKRWHRNTAQKRGGYDLVLDELEECLAGSGLPEEQLEARELTRLLDDFLDGLSTDDRVLFVRRYWYADRIQDLAGRMNTTPNNLYVRLHRIREKLKTYLIKEGIEL